jgi:hypothetical protein
MSKRSDALSNVPLVFPHIFQLLKRKAHIRRRYEHMKMVILLLESKNSIHDKRSIDFFALFLSVKIGSYTFRKFFIVLCQGGKTVHNGMIKVCHRKSPDRFP